MTHGQILCGTATVPNLDLALADYRDRLGLQVADGGTIADELANSWGAPAVIGSRFVTLQPRSRAPSWLRLIEQPLPPAFMPTRTYGWAAFEITVQDVFGWPARLEGSGFTIVGPPREIEGLPYFVAMQMTGTGREMIYLNEVRQDTPSSDLPRAASPTDHIFIVILACANREAAVAWYADTLGLDPGGSYTIEYTMINKAFGLAGGTQSTIQMVQKGRLPIIEVDGYPDAATPRPIDAGRLPPGNAIVTLAVDSFDGLAPISAPVVRAEPPYDGRRTATMSGPAGELIELVEI